MTSVGPSGAGCDSSAMPLPLPVAAPDFPVSGKTVWMPHANDRHFPEANFRPLQQSRAIFAVSFLLRLSYYAKENCGKTLSVFIYGQSSAFFRPPTGCMAFDCIDVEAEGIGEERHNCRCRSMHPGLVGRSLADDSAFRGQLKRMLAGWPGERAESRSRLLRAG